MGIIVSCLPGLGRELVNDVYRNDVKILDKSEEKEDFSSVIDELKEKIADYDIAFVDYNGRMLEALCDAGFDFDFFYIPKERKVEIITLLAKNRVDFNTVKDFDNNFHDNLQLYESLIDEHCHKHLLKEPHTTILDHRPMQIYLEECKKNNKTKGNE